MVLVDVESLSVDAEGVSGPGPSDACSLRGRSHVTAAAEPGHTTTRRPEYSRPGLEKLVLLKFNFFEK